MGDRLIFENTSWRFKLNEQWAITGPNGSGKSLLADALRGRLPLVKGELTYHFKPEPGFTPEDCIGFVSFENRKHNSYGEIVQSRWQSLELDHALTVSELLSYENVMGVNPFEVTDLHERERPRFESRRARAIKSLGLEPLLDRKVLVLSNGETQKVQLARALSPPLRLLILDEPFTGLDADSGEVDVRPAQNRTDNNGGRMPAAGHYTRHASGQLQDCLRRSDSFQETT